MAEISQLVSFSPGMAVACNVSKLKPASTVKHTENTCSLLESED